jgi:dihydrofolate reductase
MDMSRIIVSEFVSLDGVFEDPHEWHFPFFNEQARQYKMDELRAADALLLGRETYEGFAEAWPERSGDEFSEKYNAMPKYVASSTLKHPSWNNTSVLAGDLAAELAGLKDQYRQDIYVHGSGLLANSLLQQGLIDEVRLMVHPVLVGKGRRFFENGTSVAALALAGITTYESGVVLMTYRPADAPASQQPAW